jgi:hypothetical protein
VRRDAGPSPSDTVVLRRNAPGGPPLALHHLVMHQVASTGGFSHLWSRMH